MDSSAGRKGRDQKDRGQGEKKIDEFFTTHVLNTDPKNAERLDYSAIHYPNLFATTKVDPEFIQDGLWVSGFLDRATRDKDLSELVSKEPKKKKKIKEPSFLKKKNAANALSESQRKQGFGSLSTVSVGPGDGASVSSLPPDLLELSMLESPRPTKPEKKAQGATATGAKALVLSLANASGKTSRKSVASTKRTQDGSLSEKTSKTQGTVGSKSIADTEDDEEVEEQDIGSDAAAAEQLAASLAESVSALSENTHERDMRKRMQDAYVKRFKPYLDTLASPKAFKRKEKAKKREATKAMRIESEELEEIFEIQRIENECARRIQRAWRRVLNRNKWRYLVMCQYQAREIQRVVRGMITRKWVARWNHVRTKVIVTWQALVRKLVCEAILEKRFGREREAIIKIQRVVRGKIGRARWQRIQQDKAATMIQATWRGIITRCAYDKKWLAHVVQPIQNMMRRKIALNRYRVMRKELDTAASIVQRQFRQYRSCKNLGEALWKREIGYRTNIFTVLTAEEEFYEEKLEKQVERLIKGDLKSLAEAKLDEYMAMQKKIDAVEKEIDIARRERDNLSPRAMIQGWLPELIENIASKRKEVTALKLQAVFEGFQEVQKMDESLEAAIHAIEATAAARNRLSLWRDLEYFERRDMIFDKEVAARKKMQEQLISDEARKWKVVPRTADGKPDKRGKKAGPEKATYSAGVNVDILTNLNDIQDPLTAAAAGSEESVKQTLSKLTLKTYIDQVNTYEQLLNPLMKIMNKGLGVDPMHESTENMGWGLEGVELKMALNNIGIGEMTDEDQYLYGGGRGMQEGSFVDSHTRSAGNTFGMASPSMGTADVDNYDDEGDDILGNGLDEGPLGVRVSWVDDYDDDESEMISDLGGNNSSNNLLRSVSSGLQDQGASALRGIGGSGNLLPSNRAKERQMRAVQRAERRAAAAVKDRMRDDLLREATGFSPKDSHERPLDLSRVGSFEFSVLTDEGGLASGAHSARKGFEPGISSFYSTDNIVQNKMGDRRAGGPLLSASADVGLGRGGLTALAGGAGGLSAGGGSGDYQSKSSSGKGSKIRPIAEILSDARRMQAEAQQREAAKAEKERERIRVAKRRARKKENRRSAAIPWALLDELEGEKAKFEDEKGYNEVFHRF